MEVRRLFRNSLSQLTFTGGIERVSIEFIRQNARAVLGSSPIEYIRNAKPYGSLFEPTSSGMISGVNTGFFVDHGEPLEALRYTQRELNWPLGELPDGSEFLLLLPRTQLRSRSSSGPSKPLNR